MALTMEPSIRSLDANVERVLRASVQFPRLSAIVYALVQIAVAASPARSIDVRVRFAPHWQIVCTDDGAGFTTEALQYLVNDAQTPKTSPGSLSSLAALAFIGTVHIETSNTIMERQGDQIRCEKLQSTYEPSLTDKTVVGIRNFYHNLPVRRKMLLSPAALRTEVEDCRRMLSSMAILVPHLHVVLCVTGHYESEDRTIVQCYKSSSIARRCEQMFQLPISDPSFAIPIRAQSDLLHGGLSGFVVRRTLPNRAFQQVFVNGRPLGTYSFSAVPRTNLLGGESNATLVETIENILLAHISESALGPEWVKGNHLGYMLHLQGCSTEALSMETATDLFVRLLKLALNQNIDMAAPNSSEDTQQHHATTSYPQTSGSMVDFGRLNKSTLIDRGNLVKDAIASNEEQGGTSLDTFALSLSRLKPAIDSHPSLTTRSAISSPASISRSDLLASNVVGQVDASLIACYAASSHRLLLVDQHAAHERIRFEALLNDYATDCFANIENPLITAGLVDVRSFDLVTRCDAETALRLMSPEARSYLRMICIQIESVRTAGDEGVGDEQKWLRVVGVPCALKQRLIRDRNRLVPRLVADLSQWLYDVTLYDAFSHFTHDYRSKKERWLLIVRHVPSIVVDLFASLSCRGAIMFKDPLSNVESQSLIFQLSNTTCPLICAHGRTSVAEVALPNDGMQSPDQTPIDWSSVAMGGQECNKSNTMSI